MNSLKGFLYGIGSWVRFGLIGLLRVGLMEKGMMFDWIVFYGFVFGRFGLGGMMKIKKE